MSSFLCGRVGARVCVGLGAAFLFDKFFFFLFHPSLLLLLEVVVVGVGWRGEEGEKERGEGSCGLLWSRETLKYSIFKFFNFQILHFQIWCHTKFEN